MFFHHICPYKNYVEISNWIFANPGPVPHWRLQRGVANVQSSGNITPSGTYYRITQRGLIKEKMAISEIQAIFITTLRPLVAKSFFQIRIFQNNNCSLSQVVGNLINLNDTPNIQWRSYNLLLNTEGILIEAVIGLFHYSQGRLGGAQSVGQSLWQHVLYRKHTSQLAGSCSLTCDHGDVVCLECSLHCPSPDWAFHVERTPAAPAFVRI